MSDLSKRVRDIAIFDDDACHETAKHEDSDGYFGFIRGAKWQYGNSRSLLLALADACEALDWFDANWGANDQAVKTRGYRVAIEQLTAIEKALG